MAVKPSAFRSGVIRAVAQGSDLTLRQLAVLVKCYESPKDAPLTVRGLAEACNIVKPAVTRAVDKLANMKMVTREEDPADRRSVLIKLTPAGREWIAAF